MANSLYWLRWASSMSMKIFGSVRGFFIFFIAVANLLITVVMIESLLFSSSSTNFLPVVAFSTSLPHLRNVLVICASRSVRSVTSTMRGFFTTVAIFCASITIVSDFPLPCVCQTTPPLRLPASICCILSTVSLTVKYC